MSKSQERRLKIQMKLSERMRGMISFDGEFHALIDEVEQLEAEHARLRELLYKAYGMEWTEDALKEGG